MITMLPGMVFAAAPTENWNESVADSFAGGSGTKEEPYQIATAEQLAKLAADVNAGRGTVYRNTYFELTNDIDLSGKLWDPIGYTQWDTGWDVAFCGYFDGNNHTISGMYVDVRGKKSTGGLFGRVAATSTDPVIKDLTVEGEVYAAGSIGTGEDPFDLPGAGILVGDLNNYASAAYVTVENCHVSGKVYSESDNVGGMFGAATRLHISDSSADVEVTGEGSVGGFVGRGFIGEYTDCTAAGTVNGAWCVGGFAGRLYGEFEYTGQETDSVFVNHCMTSADVTADDWRAGGFVGYVEDTSISNSVAMGDVQSTLAEIPPRAGCFVGEVNNDYGQGATITNSHATGTGTVENNDVPVGGFIGYLSGGTVTDCSYNGTANEAVAIVTIEENGTVDIAKTNAADVLSNICEDYYGGHQYGTELIVDNEPTCTEDGSKSYHCERCGSRTNIQTIPATGHTAGTAWKSNETKHWNECTTCGDKLNEADHTFEWVTDKDATKNEKGSKHEECTVCGYQRAAEEIPATGDNPNIALWMILLLAADTALTGTAIYSRKRKYNR